MNMTVRELIEALKCYSDDKEVMFSYPSGDYWGTTLAGSVDIVDIADVKYSDYHGTHKVVENNGEEDDDNETQEVILIS